MSTAYQLRNFIDFYFQYIGGAVPKEFKVPLLDLTEDVKISTQLYIILAHILFKKISNFLCY